MQRQHATCSSKVQQQGAATEVSTRLAAVRATLWKAVRMAQGYMDMMACTRGSTAQGGGVVAVRRACAICGSRDANAGLSEAAWQRPALDASAGL
jgi:hypothetical protein